MAVRRLGGGLTKAEQIGAAVTSELGSLEKQLQQPLVRNRGVFERVQLESVRPDPKNPRNLNLTWEELQQTVDELEKGRLDSRSSKRAKDVEAILAKAANFKLIGQLQPITVYRDERGMLRVVDGERRYWAARLAGWTEIDAKVRSTKPEYLRLEQYSANKLREDLALGEELGNLELVIEEKREAGGSVNSLSELAALTGRPRGTMQRWWTILQGPEDVKAALREGRIESLELAYTAALERDDGRRAALLSGRVLPAGQQEDPKPVSKPAKAGRPKSSVALGAAKDLLVVRTLIEAVPVDVSFAQTDWTDPRSVQDAWVRFIKAVQTRLKKQQSASSRK